MHIIAISVYNKGFIFFLGGDIFVLTVDEISEVLHFSLPEQTLLIVLSLLFKLVKHHKLLVCFGIKIFNGLSP